MLFFQIGRRARELQKQSFHQQERSEWRKVEKALRGQIEELKRQFLQRRGTKHLE
jgi:hypothetical protein